MLLVMSEPALTLNPQDAGAEARTAPRVRSFLRGEIVHSNGAIRIECVVRDISESGARIQVSSAVTIPEHFDLVIPQRNQREKSRVMWQHGTEIGLAFQRDPARKPQQATPEGMPSGQAGELSHRVETLEAEISRLRSQLAQMRAMIEQVYRDQT